MFKLIHLDLIKIKCNKIFVMAKFLVPQNVYTKSHVILVYQKSSSNNEKKQLIL